MDAVGATPNWIDELKPQLEQVPLPGLSKGVTTFFQSYRALGETISIYSEDQELAELLVVTPQELSGIFPDPFSALAHACEFMLQRWIYQHVFKTKALALGLDHSLESGNWLLAANACRSIFEEAAHFEHFSSRITKNSNKCIDLIKSLPKKRPAGEQWKTQFMTAQLNTIGQLKKALEGSDFDWSTWRENNLDKYTDGQREHDDPEHSRQLESARKTHINDCLRSLEKNRNIEALAHYALLSEMVHPNMGSNLLVVSTRERLNKVLGNIQLSSRPRKLESLVWFFSIFSIPMSEIFDIAQKNIAVSQKQANFYQDLGKRFLQGEESAS